MPLFSWQRPKPGEEKENEVKIALSPEDQKKIDDAVAATAELPKIREQLDGLKGIQAFVEEQKKERDAAAAEATRKKNTQTQEDLDTEIAELMITDPQAAIKKATQNQSVAIMTLRADNIKREVFEDTDKYKYYHGDIKKEVDSLLAAQTLQARNDPGVVENCYLAVLGKHTEDIREGKIKTRFAGGESSARGTSTGSAGASGAGGKEKPVVTDDVKKIAKQFGVTAEDYAEMLDKEGIGYA